MKRSVRRKAAGGAMLLAGAGLMALFVRFTDDMPDGAGGFLIAMTAMLMMVFGAGLIIFGGGYEEHLEDERERREELERIAPRLRGKPYVTVGAAVICGIVFIMTDTGLIGAAALSLGRHELWDGGFCRVITYMFAHTGMVHLAGNLFILLTVGYRAEQLMGSKRYLILYLTSGLAGAAMILAADSPGQPGAVGASGALYGVLGYLLVYTWHERKEMGYSFFKWLMPIGIAGILETFLMPGISVYCHLGGLAWGIGIGLIEVRD